MSPWWSIVHDEPWKQLKEGGSWKTTGRAQHGQEADGRQGACYEHPLSAEYATSCCRSSADYIQ